MSTTAGDIEVQKIPKLRTGSFFPSLLERRRIDRALHAVIMEAYVHGVSTRSVDDLVAAMGVDSGLSKSEVSGICAGLDKEIDAFRTRSLAHTQSRMCSATATFAKSASASTWSLRRWWWPPGCPLMAPARCWAPAVCLHAKSTLPRVRPKRVTLIDPQFHAVSIAGGCNGCTSTHDCSILDSVNYHIAAVFNAPVLPIWRHLL